MFSSTIYIGRSPWGRTKKVIKWVLFGGIVLYFLIKIVF